MGCAKRNVFCRETFGKLGIIPLASELLVRYYRLLWTMLKPQTNLNIPDIHKAEILPSCTK